MALEDLKIEGIDAEVDSFAACVAAAITYWNREYDYAYVAGMSGASFSPVWYETETCAAWWTEFGNDTRIQFLGKSLGFHVRESPVVLPGEREKFTRTGEMSRDRQVFWQRAKEAVEEGKIVLVGTWPCWSIITEWNDDFGQMKVAALKNVATLCVPNQISRAYILTSGAATITRMEALKDALSFGADVADGTFQLPEHHYGGKLYDAILKRAVSDNFCGDCGDREWSCVVRTMNRIHGTNRTASIFLDFAGEFMGRQLPKPALETVIRGYKTITELAANYTDPQIVEQNWNDKDFRTEFISKVQAMKVAHTDAARIFRRLAEEIETKN